MDQQSEKQDVDLEFYIELINGLNCPGKWEKFERAIKDLAIPDKTRHNYLLITKELIKVSKSLDEERTKRKELEIKYENKAQVWPKKKYNFRSISHSIFFLIGPGRDSSLRKF